MEISGFNSQNTHLERHSQKPQRIFLRMGRAKQRSIPPTLGGRTYQEILTPVLKRTPPFVGELIRRSSLRDNLWQRLFPRFVNPSADKVQNVIDASKANFEIVFEDSIPTQVHVKNPSFREDETEPEHIEVTLPEGIKIPNAAATIGDNESHSDYLLKWFSDAFHAAFHMAAACNTKPLKDAVIFASEMFKVFNRNNLGEELPMQVRIFSEKNKTYIHFNESIHGEGKPKNSRIGNVSSSDIHGLYLNAVLRVLSDSSLTKEDRVEVMRHALIPFSQQLNKIYTQLRPENKTIPFISIGDAATRFDRSSGSAGDQSYIQLQAWETLHKLNQIIKTGTDVEAMGFAKGVLVQLAKINVQATQPDLLGEEQIQAVENKYQFIKTEMVSLEETLRKQIEQHYWITQEKLETLEKIIRTGNRENEQKRNDLNPFNIKRILYKPKLTQGEGYFAELVRTGEMSGRFVSMANFTQALGGGFATYDQLNAIVKYVKSAKLDLPFPIQAMHPMPNWKEVTVGDDANLPYQNHWGKQARDAAYYILALRIVEGQQAAQLALSRVCEAVGTDLLEWNNALTGDAPLKDHKVGGQTWTITGVLMSEKIANSSEVELLQIAKNMGLHETILLELSRRAQGEEDITSITPKEQAA